MTVFDYVAIAVVGLSLVLGLLRGAVRELFALAAWVVAFLVAKTFGVELARLLDPTIADASLRLIAAFTIIFVVALVLMSALGLALSAAIKKIGLAPIDRTLGLAIGAARGVVVMLILVILGGMTALPQQAQWRNALTSKWFETLALGVKHWLPEGLAKYVHFRSTKA